MKRKYPLEDISIEGEENIDSASKTAKIDQDDVKRSTIEFDIVQLRKDLNNPKNGEIALNQFLQVCTNPDCNEDYMLEYLENGGNAHEILRQITNKKNLSLAGPSFHIFQLLLVKVQSIIPHLIPITEEASRYFLNNFQPTIEMMISEHSSAKHKKVILKLLASMVTLNSELGIEILNQLSVNPKNMGYLTTKAAAGDLDSVRSALIQFIISFTVEGNVALLKALLEKHGLLSLVIPGLVNDDVDTVLMILNVLTTIVENVVLSKTLKLHTFNHQVIQELFKLFNWVGPKNTTKPVQTQSRDAISEVLYQLLLKVCTSSKHGVYFTDNSFGTNDAQKNQNIYKALQSVKRPWESEKQSQLVLLILSLCPEFTKCIFHVIEQAYQPKNCYEWYQTNMFLKKVLLNHKPENTQKLKNFTHLNIFNYIKSCFLPIGILKLLTESTSADDYSLINELFFTLFTILLSLRGYLEELEKNFDVNVLNYVRGRLEIFLVKHFPSVDNLVKIHNEILHEDWQELKSSYLQMPHKTRMLINVINVLKIYFEIQPHLVENAIEIDTIKLLDLVKDLEDEDILELKIKVVSLMVYVDKYALSPEKPLFREMLLTVLQVYANSHDEIHAESKSLLKEMLRKTNLFDENKMEIDVLLFSISSLSKDVQENVFNCIVAVVENVFLNMSKYNQLLIEGLSDTMGELDVTNVELEDIFDKIESSDRTTHRTKLIPFYYGRNVSTFLVSLLKYLKKNKSLRNYVNPLLTRFFVYIFHLQESPNTLIKLIEGFKVDSNLKSYIESWASEPRSLKDFLLCEDSTINIISQFCLSGKSYTKDIFLIKDVNNKREEVVTWIIMILFYVVNEAKLQKLTTEKCVNYEKILDYVLQEVIKGEDYQSVIESLTVERMLSHPTFIKLFTPYSRKVNTQEKLLTDLIVHYIQYFTQCSLQSPIQDLLHPYRVKLFLNLNSEIKRSKKKGKGLDSANLLNVVKSVSLRDDDYLKILDNLLELDISSFIKDESEPSTWLDILSLIIKKFSNRNETLISKETFSKIVICYDKILCSESIIKITEFEESLFTILQAFPQYVKEISTKVFETILKTKFLSSAAIKLGTFLLQSDSKFLGCFESNLNNEILSRRELILPYGKVYIMHKCAKLLTLQTIFKEYKSTLMKIIEKPHKAGQTYIDNKIFVAELIHSCMSIDESINIINKDHKFEIAEGFHIEFLQAVAFRILLSDNDVKVKCVNQYLIKLLNFAVIALKNITTETDTIDIINRSLDMLISFCSTDKKLTIGGGCNFDEVISNVIWQNYCKQTLKFSLKLMNADQDSHETNTHIETISLMSKLVQFLYPKNHDDIISLFEMATSHSEFLNVMLSNHSEMIKSKLLEFLLMALIKNKSVMKSTHIPVYLSAYHATMSPSDRLILAILHAYETNGQPMHEYQPYLWGDAAASYYSVRRKKSSTLWSRPTSNQLLNLLEKEKIDYTIKYFPTNQKLNYIYELPNKMYESYKFIHTDASIRSIVDKMCKDKVLLTSIDDPKDDLNYCKVVQLKIQVHGYGRFIRDLREVSYTNRSHVILKGNEQIYDPAFILSLMSHILSPESVVSCFKVIRSGVISVCLMALSSECPSMRAAAYYVISRFYTLLEAETKHKSDKFILTQFIETLKASLSSLMKKTTKDHLQNPRLPAISSMYLARALTVITAPFDPLYKPVNNFMIARTYIDFTVVPDLLSLLHDCAVEHTSRRQWILQIIRDGMRTATDANICFKSMSFKMILDLYSSVLSDRKTRRLILEVLQISLSIPKIAEILINGHGIISWLSGVFKKLSQHDSELLSLCVSIVDNIWYSLLCNSLFSTLSKVYVNVMNKQSAIDRVKVLSNVSIYRDTEMALFSLLLEVLPRVDIMSSDVYTLYLRVMKKFTKSCMKLLSKQMLVVLINSNKGVRDEFTQIILQAIDARNSDALRALQAKIACLFIENEEDKLSLATLTDFCIHWLSH